MAEVATHTPSPIHTQNLSANSPPSSPSSLSKKRLRSPLSIDLSTVPPMTHPAPPSNTLLITRLHDPKIFHPASLATVRQHINSIAPLNSFSPLKSMSRIICSFYDTDAAINVRQAIDRTTILGESVAKCYFGEPTPIDASTKYLNRPDAGRLFFISPPPSPPVGWEMRSEDPPNKEVHAEDLATKLQKLTGKMEISTSDDAASPMEDIKMQYTSDELHKLKTTRSTAFSGVSDDNQLSPVSASTPKKIRSRSSTLIYDPKAHGDSPALPAVMVEGTDDEDDDSDVQLDAPAMIPVTRTARPPVELMEH